VRRKNRNKKTETRKEPRPVIRYVDAEVVVVEKPAGLTTMRHAEEAAEFGGRARRFLPPTLADILPDLLTEHERRGRLGKRNRASPGRGNKSPSRPFSPAPPRSYLRAVHRLDKETSGLVVFARTRPAERHLGLQFRAHSIERRYLAVVRGHARPGKIESWLVRDRGDGRRGSTPGGRQSRNQEQDKPGRGIQQNKTAQRAVTHVRVLENLGDFTLVECRLETGRTHQVRIHLGEAGTPICGERIYDRPLHGKPVPDSSRAPRLVLHATRLDFDHPATGRRMTFSSAFPADLAEWLERICRQGSS
jgi:23S rRNA pseudouridine1911/1915/1917 synthase